MAEKGKTTNKRLLWLAIIAAGALIVLPRACKISDEVINPPGPPEGVSIVDYEVSFKEKQVVISGSLENSTDIRWKAVSLGLDFYDDQNGRIDRCFFNVSKLAPSKESVFVGNCAITDDIASVIGSDTSAINTTTPERYKRYELKMLHGYRD